MGSFNPIQKYESKLGIFPNFRGEHKKYFKPPPSLGLTLLFTATFGKISRHMPSQHHQPINPPGLNQPNLGPNRTVGKPIKLMARSTTWDSVLSNLDTKSWDFNYQPPSTGEFNYRISEPAINYVHVWKVYRISLGRVRFGSPSQNSTNSLNFLHLWISENFPHLPFATGSSSFEETCVFCKICIPWRWPPGNTGSAGIKGYVSDVLLVLDVPLDLNGMILQVVGAELGALRLIDGCCISFMDLPPPNRRMMEGSWHSNCRFSFVRIWPVAGPKNGVICWLWGGKKDNWQSSYPSGNEKTYPTKREKRRKIINSSLWRRLKRGYVMFPF